MISAHHAAAKARLEAAAILSGKIADAVRIDTGGTPIQANYVVLNTNLPLFAESRLTSDQSVVGDQLLECSVRVVTVDLAGLHRFMDAVNAQFVGHRLIVGGRALTALRREELADPDYDFAGRVYFQDAIFAATSSRAA